MTAIPQSWFDGHMVRVVEDMPTTFRWNGVDYQGVRTTPDVTQEMEIGGVDEKIQFNLYVRAATLPAVKPDIGDEFLIGGVAYKVVALSPSPDGGVVFRYGLAFARLGSPIEQ